MTEGNTYFRYLPASPRDAQWGAHVTTAGRVKVPPNGQYPPQGHPRDYAFSWDQGRVLQEYQLHLITGGSGTFESESAGKRKLEAGTAYLLFPGEWHRYRPLVKTGWEEYWVGFNGPWIDRLVKNRFFSPAGPVFRISNENRLLDLFTDIIGTLRTEPLGGSHIIASIVTLMLAHVHAVQRTRGRSGDRDEAIVRDAKQWLAGRIDRSVNIPDLARHLGVGYAWLRRTFRHHTGLSPNEYHMQMRIAQATDLLGGTELTISEVADALGYSDPQYFSRIFKAKSGRTPAEWRNLSRKKASRPSR